jgi:hypothetical protein
VNVWKVILATLVIYSAGLITGGLLVRPPFRPFPGHPPSPVQFGPMPWYLQERFLERMRMELNLTSEQATRLNRVFAESRERMRIINDLVRPEMQAEMRHTRERIVAELTPPQRQRFEELMRSRPNRPGEPPRGPRQRDQQFYSRPGSSNPPPQ